MPDLSLFNPWWQQKAVPPALAGKTRRILGHLLDQLAVRQMVILSGVRRAGKTTLMYQIIQHLLSERVDPYRILYFSFDEAEADIKSILDEYEKNILKQPLSEPERVYMFFDEIQKLVGWADQVKLVYDLNPNIKMFLSGSASIDIRRGTRESLAGRFFDFLIEPLDFDEYLEFTTKAIDRQREDLFELQLRPSLDDFIETGGFIEALTFDKSQRDKYFKESLLERVVFRDLPAVFTVRAPDLLYRLVRVVAGQPGLYVDYKNLANDLGYDQRTISEYFSYLENALLMSKLYNYSPNRLTTEKKMKRAYLSSTAFTVAISADVDRSPLLEQFFVNAFKGKFFWRSPQKDEIDLIIVTDEQVIPVEVKIRRHITMADAKALFKFLARYGGRRGYIVSDSEETTFSDESSEVIVIPYWKYWTIKKALTTK